MPCQVYGATVTDMTRGLPAALAHPPRLDSRPAPPPIRGRALLINPFYRKDPYASFGKHVLTPSLALTSIAGATPAAWSVSYWDENLLQGPPPIVPFPQVVGITVHLTFAARAFELAAYYRARGALVVLGGLHVLSCPDECRPHADALAIGEGVQLWPRILRDVDRRSLQREYQGSYREPPYGVDPPPARARGEHAHALSTPGRNIGSFAPQVAWPVAPAAAPRRPRTEIPPLLF